MRLISSSTLALSLWFLYYFHLGHPLKDSFETNTFYSMMVISGLCIGMLSYSIYQFFDDIHEIARSLKVGKK